MRRRWRLIGTIPCRLRMSHAVERPGRSHPGWRLCSSAKSFLPPRLIQVVGRHHGLLEQRGGIMTRRWFVAAAVLGGILSISVLVTGANAAEIRVLSAVAMKPALDDLAREFERSTGHTIEA